MHTHHRRSLPRDSANRLNHKTCNFCGECPSKIIDAPTNQGSWAHMCVPCWRIYGRGSQGTTHDNTLGQLT